MLRLQDKSRTLALAMLSLLVLAACATRHKTPTRSVRTSRTSGASTKASPDSLSTLSQLRSFLPDSSATSDSLQPALRDTLPRALADSLSVPSPDSLPTDSISLAETQRRADSLARAQRRARARSTFDDIYNLHMAILQTTFHLVLIFFRMFITHTSLLFT